MSRSSDGQCQRLQTFQKEMDNLVAGLYVYMYTVKSLFIAVLIFALSKELQCEHVHAHTYMYVHVRMCT